MGCGVVLAEGTFAKTWRGREWAVWRTLHSCYGRLAGLMLRSVKLKGKGMTRWAEAQPQAQEFEPGQEVIENCCGVLSRAVAGSDSHGAFQQPTLRLNRRK